MQLQQSAALRTPQRISKESDMGKTVSRSVLNLHTAGILCSKEIPQHTRSHLGIGVTGFTSACFRKESAASSSSAPTARVQPCLITALPHCHGFPPCFCGRVKKEVWSIHPLHWGSTWSFDGDGFSLMVLEVQFLVCFPLILFLAVSVFKGNAPN